MLGSDESGAAAENIAMPCLPTATACTMVWRHLSIVSLYCELSVCAVWCGCEVEVRLGASRRSQETQYRDLHGERN